MKRINEEDKLYKAGIKCVTRSQWERFKKKAGKKGVNPILRKLILEYIEE